jgi:ATP-dependent Lon protease
MSINDQTNEIMTRSKRRKIDSKIETYPNSESDEDYNPGSDVEMSDSDNDNSESEVSETELKEELEYLKKDSPNTRRRKENIKYEESFDIMEMEQEDQHILGQIFGKYLSDSILIETEESSTESTVKNSNMTKYEYVEDNKYFQTLDSEKQQQILNIETEISKLNTNIIPLRFSIIESNLDLNNKAIAIRKIDNISRMDSNSGEYYKIKNWIDGILKIQFGKYIDLPLSINDSDKEIQCYLKNTQEILNRKVYGHHTAKGHILQIISQWIVNPTSIGSVLAIQGPMGIGKTTLVKEGIAKCLNRPYFFISLGGATDSSFLDGHSYTYEGSQPGKIVEILKQAQCMNPIIYFDELDKISNTTKGDEITNLLIHITDCSQNSHFQDKYYSGIDIDLSRCLFIFSYNNIQNVNPILLDRMYNIQLDDFKLDDKITISLDYLLPEILEMYKLTKEDIIFDRDTITYIIKNYCKEDGVRNIKRSLETIISKINVLKLGSGLDLQYSIENIKFPLIITNDIIEKLLSKNKHNDPPFQMYT